MLNLTTDLVVNGLGGKTIVGGVTLPNDRLAIVCDDGTLVMIEGKALLFTKQESEDALNYVRRATARQGAALVTLDRLTRGHDPGARLIARREATVQERDHVATRVPVKTIVDKAVISAEPEYPTVGE